MEHCFVKQIESMTFTIPKSFVKIVVGYVKKNLKKKTGKKQVVENHCHLKTKFRELAHDTCSLFTWNKNVSFVQNIYHNFFWKRLLSFLKKVIKIDIERGFEINRANRIAKSSELSISVKIARSKYQNFCIVLVSEKIKWMKFLQQCLFFPILIAYGSKGELNKKKLAYS